MDYQSLLDKESKKQSSYSPCTVSSNEFICRALFAPRHYKNGKVQPAAFEQILSPDGMSVLRKSYSFKDSLKETIEIIQCDEKHFVKCISASVADIRAILCEKFRLIYVLDTAREKVIGHADLV